jgi:hypothetical protein
MSRLYLDDIRTPRTELNFDIVRNYEEFVMYILTNGLPNVVSFDHDLSLEHYEDYLSDKNWDKSDEEVQLDYDSYKEKTGYDCAKWLVDYCIDNQLILPTCFVHSENRVGGDNIISYINNYLRFIEGKEGRCARAMWKQKQGND